jgi:hypothetical protein
MPLLSFLIGMLFFGPRVLISPQSLKPQVVYGTYIGGHNKEGTTSLAVDAAGYVWVTGHTPSPDFPITPEAFKTSTTVNNDDFIGFLTKLSPAGDRFVYSTFVGGSFRNAANAVAVDSAGNAVLVGSTCSVDFPVTQNAIQRKLASGVHGLEPCDGYVVKLDPSGSHADYATYFGGSDVDSLNSVAIGSNGEAVVTGLTRSQDLFGTRAFGESDGVVALIGLQGELKWIRRFGGSGNDWFNSVAVAPDGTIWIAGTSDSTDLPCSGRVASPPYGFVVGLREGRAPLCVRFAGEPTALSLDRRGQVYVAGSLREAEHTTGFAVKLNEGRIVWYQKLGGSDETKISAISAGLPGSVFLCGSSYSRDFPVTSGALAHSPAGGSDMVLLRLSANDGKLLYGTFLGGNVAPNIAWMNNTAVALHADARGTVWIAGNAIGHPEWITPNAAQAQSHGNTDAFVLKLRFAELPGEGKPRALNASPDRSDQRTTQNSFVLRDQSQAVGAGRSTDETISRIFGIVVGKRGRESRDLRRDLYDLHVRFFKGRANGGLNTARRPQSPVVIQQRKFPKRNRRNGEFPVLLRFAQLASRIPRQAARVGDHPDKDMGVKQDHFRASQSSAGTTGETMSPRISIFPFSESKAVVRNSSVGTNFAIGLPRFVMTTGVLVARTWSITCRHLALNLPAAMVFIVTSI